MISLRLWLLPSVALKNRHKLPHEPGVYYAMKWLRVLYIGRATNLHERWNKPSWDDRSHHQLEPLQRYGSVRLHYKVLPLWRIKHTEAIGIQRYQPPLNKRNEKPVWWIYWLDNALLGIVVAIVWVLIYAWLRYR